MYCVNCGAELKDDSRFCTVCGARLADDLADRATVCPSSSTPSIPSLDPCAPRSVPGVKPHHPRHRLVAIAAILAIVAIVAVMMVIGLMTNWFGFASVVPGATPTSAPQEQRPTLTTELQQGTTESESQNPDSVKPAVHATVADYSWEELSQISTLISSADSRDEALGIAADYHLCNADGTLDGTQTKTLVLDGGIVTIAAVAGFNHDTRADGVTAGITFVSLGVVGAHVANVSDVTSGGWRDSDLRAWMNNDLLAQLPSDLSPYVVPVIKMTNAAGQTTDPTDVVATIDTLWAPSYAELGGHMDVADSGHDEVFNAEGNQYQLYSDLGVRWDTPNSILAIAGTEHWWERSPDPIDGRYFMNVGEDGAPWCANTPSNEYGVVMGFCV